MVDVNHTNQENFDMEQYYRILENNQIGPDPNTKRSDVVLELVNSESFESKQRLLDMMDDDDSRNYERYSNYGSHSIDYCFKKGWIKYLTKEDIEFDQACFNECILHTFSPYVENHIGLTREGAGLYNNIELQIDQVCGRNPYGDIVQYTSFENSHKLQGLYADVVKMSLDKTVNSLRYQYQKSGRNIDVSYIDPYEAGHWYPRRYIKLDKSYRADIFYKIW